MASLRKVRRSPFWYLRRKSDTGGWSDECLKLRWASKSETRTARSIEARVSAQEADWSSGESSKSGQWDRWVDGFLVDRFENPRSLARYRHAWGALRRFLCSRGVGHPMQVRYEHAGQFLTERTASGEASHNTARLEIKFLSLLMGEAMRREFCDRNPIALVRVRRSPPKEKPDLSDDDILRVRLALAARPLWMRVVFEVLLHCGCRFGEASIPWERVDFSARTILFEDSKRAAGDSRKLFLVPMSDQLRGFLYPLRNNGTRTVPVLTGTMNHRFNLVMKNACGATSHSCRVAFVSRCHRAGLSEGEVMRLVNHSTRLVHAIYTRLSVADARRSLSQVALPPPPPT
jgi:integrase